MKEEYEMYSTSDIYFCAYLCALDIPLERTEPKEQGDRRKMTFIFKVSPGDISRLKASYFGGTGTVKALKFVERLRSLKSMCFI